MNIKRLIALFVSLALVALLLAKLDLKNLWGHLRGLDPKWFGAALLLFLPQTLIIAHRWRMIAEPLARMSLKEAGQQVLAANTLNLVLPSKMGDMAKGVFLHRQGRCSIADGIQIVVFEKLLDLAALSLWMLLGWMIVPMRETWALAVLALGAFVIGVVIYLYFAPHRESGIVRMIPEKLRGKKAVKKVITLLEAGPRVSLLIRAGGGRRRRIVAWSMTIWFLHLLQIWCFFRAVGIGVTLFMITARMPIAIFAGLLPLTIAGVGTRDWAILAVFHGLAANDQLAAAAVLISLRYVVPAIGGFPFLHRYLVMSREAKSSE
ncbi:hypothetical protein BH09SUM1_BH09SUM1_10550 [soil metagenome]